MKLLLLILVCIGALFVIAAGVWVAVVLTAAVLRPWTSPEHNGNETQ